MVQTSDRSKVHGNFLLNVIMLFFLKISFYLNSCILFKCIDAIVDFQVLKIAYASENLVKSLFLLYLQYSELWKQLSYMHHFRFFCFYFGHYVLWGTEELNFPQAAFSNTVMPLRAMNLFTYVECHHKLPA